MEAAGVAALAVIAVVVLMGQAAAVEATEGRATVKRDKVAVYAQMATTSEVVTTLKRGAVVTVDFVLIGPEGAWCHITTVGSTGYVLCDVLVREPPPRGREGPAQAAPPRGKAPPHPAPGASGQTRKTGIPLIDAAIAGDAGRVRALLAAGADVDAKNPFGATALMVAAFFGHFDIVHALLAAGADVNAKDADGGTALMEAAWSGRTDTVQALLAAGADVNAKGMNKVTALDFAYMGRNTDIVRILKEAGARE